MDAGDSNIAHLIQAAWSGILTVLGALVFWNWNKLNKQVDEKADKTDVEPLAKKIDTKADRSEITQLRDDLKSRWEAQDKMHTENRNRLDSIFQLLVQGKDK